MCNRYHDDDDDNDYNVCVNLLNDERLESCVDSSYNVCLSVCVCTGVCN